MTIPQNDGFTVVLNRVTGQATYSADADTFSGEIDIFSNQVNDQATEMNATAIGVNQASNAAVGAANYKGKWSLATGAASQGESFLHENQVWTLNVNVADITLSEPSSVNTDWRAIDSSLYQYAVSQLADGDFSKVAIIYAGLVIDTYDYVVYQEDGRIYFAGSVTGTFSNPLDFDPDTGVDSGLSGSISNIKIAGQYLELANGGTVDGDIFSSVPQSAIGNSLTRRDFVLSSVLPTLDTSDYAKFADRRSSGSLGGSSVVGQQSRVLASVEINNIAGASLSANSVTLPAGTYYVVGSAPAAQVAGHQAWLRDTSTGFLVNGLEGSTAYASTSTTLTTRSEFRGLVTFAIPIVVDVRHHTDFATASFGLGVEAGSGNDEIYTVLEIWRVG